MDEEVPEHKLCGFLSAVLCTNHPNVTETLKFGTPCFLFEDTTGVSFRSECGVVLAIIGQSKTPEHCGVIERETISIENLEQSSQRLKRKLDVTPQDLVKSGASGGGTSKRRRLLRSIGLVDGSLSVVHQLHALVMHNCIQIVARVIHVETSPGLLPRVVVLVDVYLPIELWYGWQFPKSGSVAAALFRHLSCDWGLRRMIVVGKKYWEEGHGEHNNIWSLPDCHTLTCKLHCGAPDSSKRRLFELHEIFKNLPCVSSLRKPDSYTIIPLDSTSGIGIWDIPNDILIKILSTLGHQDIMRVAATCHCLRSAAHLIVPSMKLKLYPHQQAAVDWMLHRERNAESLLHPLYTRFTTEDECYFYMHAISGHLDTGFVPIIKDFRGGLFCDEPGLGKTITALSLILKRQGTMADAPEGVQVIWCTHNGDKRCAYYECDADRFTSNSKLLDKSASSSNTRRGQFALHNFTPVLDVDYAAHKRDKLLDIGSPLAKSGHSFHDKGWKTPQASHSKSELRSKRSLSCISKNLFNVDDGASNICEGKTTGKNKRTKACGSIEQDCKVPLRKRKACADHIMQNETWVQCDSCYKWRKLLDSSISDATALWFCSMNSDTAHQSCEDQEEAWDASESLKYLQGFYTKGMFEKKNQNVSFFTGILREHKSVMNSSTKKALLWLANLSPDRLSEMETVGVPSPVLGSYVDSNAHGFHKICKAFGLIRRNVKGVTKWYYPQNLDNLAFDLPALRIALCEPLDIVRLYLSRATLIVVPANLVDHWITQIQRHVRPGQLRLYIWTDRRIPSTHSLAWDYDVVITTFSRLSAEWSPHKKSPLMQVHWLRVILDEGHTLGSSLNLTNKFQMAVSLTASTRWLLTGTPTPNTPNSQLSHLQPLLKFLHEEAYGENRKSWEAGILKPFEAEMEEGRIRLLKLLGRCMISARKIDLQTIPPCSKNVIYLDFTEDHARSYNELVETVRRNILMADWNDPSHVESLLNSKQWKFRGATIRNVRLSCCVAGQIKVVEAGEDIQETMDILVGNSLDPLSDEYTLIKYNIVHGGDCMRCKEWSRLPIITPCRHLLCLDCVALDSTMCTLPGCGRTYEMQTPETLARPENPNPKWPVPKDLIELQPSYKQDNWNPDWQSTSSSKVGYLVQRLKLLQQANRETFFSLKADNNDYPIENLWGLSTSNKSNGLLPPDCSGYNAEANKTLPEKVIIFSQFLEHIHVIEQQLTLAGIEFAKMYSPMHSCNKMKSLATFQQDASCMALLMDGTAALGLDLSFVNHVFLMEPIWDRSVEEQVISRAHRMGATRPIHVEILAMRGTIEEQMLEFLKDADKCRRFLKEEKENPENENRSHRSLHDFAQNNYLSHLNFVRRKTNVEGEYSSSS